MSLSRSRVIPALSATGEYIINFTSPDKDGAFVFTTVASGNVYSLFGSVTGPSDSPTWTLIQAGINAAGRVITGHWKHLRILCTADAGGAGDVIHYTARQG